jgi:DNA-binding NtrC family response regulator
MARLAGYEWPGNIRELQNVLKKALIFNRGAPLQAEEMTLGGGGGQRNDAGGASGGDLAGWVRLRLRSGGQERLFDACIDEAAALLVREALEMSGGNRSRAARLLGISRPTLHARMEKYHLGTPTEGDEDGSGNGADRNKAE